MKPEDVATVIRARKKMGRYWRPMPLIKDTAIVDGQTWYTIMTFRKDIMTWIRSQDEDHWQLDPNSDMYFDISETLYFLLLMAFKGTEFVDE